MLGLLRRDGVIDDLSPGASQPPTSLTQIEDRQTRTPENQMEMGSTTPLELPEPQRRPLQDAQGRKIPRQPFPKRLQVTPTRRPIRSNHAPLARIRQREQEIGRVVLPEIARSRPKPGPRTLRKLRHTASDRLSPIRVRLPAHLGRRIDGEQDTTRTDFEAASCVLDGCGP